MSSTDSRTSTGLDYCATVVLSVPTGGALKVPMQRLRRAVLHVTPGIFLGGYRRAHLLLTRFLNQRMSARDVFSRIYSRNVWGGTLGEFCSGTGSEDRFAEPYCRLVQEFVVQLRRNRESPIVLVDLGCGDFRVGARLVGPGIRYLGADVVPELIEHHRRCHAGPGVEFQCLDITRDDLPKGSVALLRQVLQHLSNQEIACVLAKLHLYDYVFVTEHYPSNEMGIMPNRDKPHGGDTRLLDRSAVYLDQPPFNVQGLELCQTLLHDSSGQLRTFRISRHL